MRTKTSILIIFVTMIFTSATTDSSEWAPSLDTGSGAEILQEGR